MDILDPRLVHNLHIEKMRRAGTLRDEHLEDVIFQTSTIDALLDGAYEGDLTFAELREHGDFGIGTLQQLDGEMIALDGEFFVARADGSVSRVPPEMKTPFAVITYWDTDASLALENISSLAELKKHLDAREPQPVEMIAVRVDGEFSKMRVRSVSKQTPPYPPLAEVAAKQSEFEWQNISGTVVGFRFPDTARGYEVVGYHLHFLADDRTRGGHVLDCALTRGTALFDDSIVLHVEIPAGLRWSVPDASEARQAVLKRVEGT